MSPPVVLLHGTNAGPWTLASFQRFFEDAGLACHAPAYRFHDPTPTEADAPHLAGLSIADYVEDTARFVATLAAPPVIVGHSLGGVVARKLAARRLARAIVLLNGSVTAGTLPTTDAERDLGRRLVSAGPFWEGTLLPDFETMARFGLNRLEPAEQLRVFKRLGPESGRVLFELFLWMFDDAATTRIEAAASGTPALFVAGSEDLAVPPSTQRVMAESHGELATVHVADGFGHYLTLEPGWEKVARTCLHWIERAVAP